MDKAQRASKTYFKDAERVQEEIWMNINVRGKVVLDIGIGESTQKLTELGAKVVGVDTNLQKITNYKKLGIPIFVCDFLNFPFQKQVADLVVFYFTLHEINPKFHIKALTIARKIAPMVIVVEPVPWGCIAYEEFAQLWKDAMHSVGKFEDYMPPEYWKEVIQKAGFKITLEKTVKWRTYVPPTVLRNIVETTIEEWRKMGVKEYYIKKLEKFTKENPRVKWSDIIVLVGK